MTPPFAVLYQKKTWFTKINDYIVIILSQFLSYVMMIFIYLDFMRLIFLEVSLFCLRQFSKGGKILIDRIRSLNEGMIGEE